LAKVKISINNCDAPKKLPDLLAAGNFIKFFCRLLSNQDENSKKLVTNITDVSGVIHYSLPLIKCTASVAD